MKIEVTQCSMCTHYNTEQFCEVWKQYISNDAFYCACGAKADRKTEPTISKMEQVDKDINVRSKTELKTQMETQNSNLPFEKRTMRDCYNCKKYENDCECIECHYEPKDEPQTCSVSGRPYSECADCEHFRCTADELQTERSE